LEPYHIDRQEIAGLDEPQQITQLVDSFYNFVNDHVYSVRFFMSVMLRGELPGRGAQAESGRAGLRRINELYRAFRQSFVEILLHGQQRGVFDDRLDAEREAALILVTLVGILAQQFMLGESSQQAKALIDHYKQTLLERLLRK
jgi:hypothetical protein